MVRNVEVPGQCDRSVILTSHHVKPIQLHTENQWWSLNLVLFSGRHLLMTIFTIVQVLPLAQVLTSKVASQSSVNMVRVFNVQ